MPLEKLGFWLLIFLVVAFFSRFLDTTIPHVHLPGIAQGLALAIVVVTGAFMRGAKSKIALCMVLLTLWILAGVPTSYWRSGSMDLIIHSWMKVLLDFFTVSCLIVTVKQVRQIMFALGIGAAIGSVMLSISSRTTGGRLVAEAGTFANSNEIAISLLIGLPCLWLMMADSRAGRFRKAVVFGVIVIVLSILLKTGSREGLITLSVLGAAMFLHASMAGKVKLLAVAGLTAALFVTLLPPILKLRYLTMFSSKISVQSDQEATMAESAAGSTANRLSLLKNAASVTLNHPLFGVGLGNFAPYSVKEANDAGFRGDWHGTHNTYLEFFSETGIPGGLLYIAALVLAFKETNAVYRRARRLKSIAGQDLANMAFAWRCSLLAFAVVSFFAHIGYDLKVGLILAVSTTLGWSGGFEAARIEGMEREATLQPVLSPLPSMARFRDAAVNR